MIWIIGLIIVSGTIALLTGYLDQVPYMLLLMFCLIFAIMTIF